MTAELMTKRLQDSDVAVRLAALTKLIDLALVDPLKLTVASFVEMGNRAKDRKEDVRRMAVQGLAKVYCKHLSSMLTPLTLESDLDNSPPTLSTKSKTNKSRGEDRLAAESISSGVPLDVQDRLLFVPSLVVNFWGYPDMPSKLLVLQVGECSFCYPLVFYKILIGMYFQLLQEQLLPR